MQQLSDWWLGITQRTKLVGLLVLVGGSLLIWSVWPKSPGTMVPGATPPPAVNTTSVSSSKEAGSMRSSASHDQRVYVDVQGAVKHPGLYQFKVGMRVNAALAAAGGLKATADRQKVNLAARLVDQQQLYIPRKGEQVGQIVASRGENHPSATESNTAAAPVNLNTATVSELQQITGVGAKKAQKIIDYRTEHGEFKKVDDLTQIPGFGAKTVANLRDQLTT